MQLYLLRSSSNTLLNFIGAYFTPVVVLFDKFNLLGIKKVEALGQPDIHGEISYPDHDLNVDNSM